MATEGILDGEAPPPYHPSAIKQWAKSVVRYSSQYNSTSWGAHQACGAPRVYPEHGDIHGAWAMSKCDKQQFLELEFEHAVRPTAINIYETYNPGAVVAVKAQNKLGQMVTLWSTSRPQGLNQSRIFSPTLSATVLKTNIIRVDVDCSASGTWCEIDAVELVGIRDGAVMPADDTAYFNHMGDLVNNKTFSDVKFEMDGKSVYAHKAILATRSKFFLKMFGSEKQSKVDLKLPDVSYATIIAILTFIYTNHLPLECCVDTLISMCKVAPTFMLPEMRTAATYKVLAVLSCKTAVEVYMGVKNDPSLGEVHSICKSFMADNLKEMSNEKSFSSLSQNDLVEIVQMATSKMSLNS